MTDQYGRKIKYLRLSVTDLCSCRCVYCMGAEGVPKLPHEAVLSFEEIEEIVRAAVSLGVRKVRLTGGASRSCGAASTSWCTVCAPSRVSASLR